MRVRIPGLPHSETCQNLRRCDEISEEFPPRPDIQIDKQMGFRHWMYLHHLLRVCLLPLPTMNSIVALPEFSTGRAI